MGLSAKTPLRIYGFNSSANWYDLPSEWNIFSRVSNRKSACYTSIQYSINTLIKLCSFGSISALKPKSLVALAFHCWSSESTWLLIMSFICVFIASGSCILKPLICFLWIALTYDNTRVKSPCFTVCSTLPSDSSQCKWCIENKPSFVRHTTLSLRHETVCDAG